MERGDELLPALLAEVMDRMINKRFLSELAIAGSSAPDSIESLTRAGTSTELEPSAFELDEFVGPADFELEIANLFHFSEMTFGGMMEW